MKIKVILGVMLLSIMLVSVNACTPSGGDVQPTATPTEPSSPGEATKEESRQIALDYLTNSPTFQFDGVADSIELVEVMDAFCPYCWGYVFEFDSAHSGYGDRSGQALAQVITNHKMIVSVSNGNVDGATIDDFWDVEKQSEIKLPEIVTGSIHLNPSETIRVNAGEEFTIALEGNATTGYQWKAEWVAATIQLVNDNYQVNEGTDGKVGVGGTHYFTFRALDRCEVEITFKYQRSWENEPIDSVVYTVNVN